MRQHTLAQPSARTGPLSIESREAIADLLEKLCDEAHFVLIWLNFLLPSFVAMFHLDFDTPRLAEQLTVS